MVLGDRSASNRAAPDPALMAQLAKARDFHARLMKSQGATLTESASNAGVTASYFMRSDGPNRKTGDWLSLDRLKTGFPLD